MYLHKKELATTVSELRSGKTDPVNFINTTCDLMDRVEPHIHAFLPEKNRRERLISEAETLLEKYPDPETRPPLFGVPVGVKDLFRTDGFPTRGGSKLPPELFTGPEASSVTKIREAGALIAGKTVTTEFAYFQPGPTRNPHNPEHTPGGSSSGSAAAVAAGLVPFAFGTQTIGSVSRPAAFCGVVGFKPSFNRISTDGVIPFSTSADHIGFFTQDIAGINCAAPLLCSKWDADLAARKTEKPVLGIPEGAYLQQTDREALNHFNNRIALLEEQGFTVKRIRLLDNIDEINETHRSMIAAELAEAHSSWFASHKNLYSSTTVDFILEGQKVSESTLSRARAGRLELRSLFEKTMDDNGIDLFISPSAPGPAPEGIGATGNPAMNLPWTYSGLPTIALPGGKSPDGLPLGIQLTARFSQDEQLTAFAISMADGS